MRDAEALTVQGRLRAASGERKVGPLGGSVKEKAPAGSIYTEHLGVIGPTTDRSAESNRVYTSHGT